MLVGKHSTTEISSPIPLFEKFCLLVFLVKLYIIFLSSIFQLADSLFSYIYSILLVWDFLFNFWGVSHSFSYYWNFSPCFLYLATLSKWVLKFLSSPGILRKKTRTTFIFSCLLEIYISVIIRTQNLFLF
jgi:hypothetical protein